MNQKLKDIFYIFVRGLCMGSADIIPGVSGGTIALITGIYARLVNAISRINFSFMKPLFKGDFHGFKEKLLYEVDFELFIPLILGIAIAFIAMAGIIQFLMNDYPAFIFSFFLGLILASSYILYRDLENLTVWVVVLSIIGFIFSFWLSGLYNSSTLANHSLIVIFFSAMIAICAMILPGISGSFILLLIGQYEYMLNALRSLAWADIITFIVGAVIGILGFSKFLNYLLENHESVTRGFLIGIMLGGLRIPIDKMTGASFGGSIPICAILAIIGFVLIMFMETKFKMLDG